MDHQRNTHTLQNPAYNHHLTNAVTFPPLPPSFLSSNVYYPENTTFINPDQTLSHALSFLNLSPTTRACTHAPPFFEPSGNGGYGGDEGFVLPLMGHDDVIHRRWSDGVEANRQDYPLGFGVDWKVEEVEIVVSEIIGFVSDLMKDQFGNYLVQKLVAVCNDDQKMLIILSLVKDIVPVCMSPHGTRAVQKLLENLQDPNQVKLVMKGLQHGATALAVDPNGHHVIQYCLVNFNTDINMPILTEIANECYKIATDRSGCCVMQACVEHARGEVRTRIIAEVIANSVHLAEDPFGNYVLQHMVGLNIPELTALLVRQLQGNFATLSCNKYGSNVVEKCLNESGEEISTRIVLELIRSPNSALLLVDPYANFVIQSALKVSKGFAHNCLCGLISKNMCYMQTNLYGKKILGRFNKKKVSFA
ncbi:hypothetical protein M8C21_015218 [Ambrosia artemisiifolia]|uniref:PUM-HD domain-containing protein n=1 Tax=Ambrosia artemisiifolia TaxID=4212 RepID=A0AAD5DCY5_AMBAR|nr:hypothetical protein M8C21_015218 [Ambrosia artemisiifolia]